MKKIFDSIHGFIHFGEIEEALIESKPFQRLMHIHQLGAAFYVYPGATHKRFEHSLGVMELASRIYDRVIHNFYEEPQGSRLEVPKPGSREFLFWRLVLRCAALCHDIGHLPFSHVAEQAILGDKSHEVWTSRLIQSSYLRPVWEAFAHLFPEKSPDLIATHVLKISIGEKKLGELGETGFLPFSNWERIVSEMITGDFFGADRMDYLLRDAKSSGLAYGFFDYQQLIEMLRIITAHEKDPQIGTQENGIDSCESLLLSRHFMHRRIYQYPTVKSYAFHLSRFIEKTYRNGEFQKLESYIKISDHHVLTEMDRALDDSGHPGHADALSITFPKSRYKALPLNYLVSEEKIELWQKKFSIPAGSIIFRQSKHLPKSMGLNFPVLLKDGHVANAQSISNISIPLTFSHWAFIHPESAKNFQLD